MWSKISCGIIARLRPRLNAVYRRQYELLVPKVAILYIYLKFVLIFKKYITFSLLAENNFGQNIEWHFLGDTAHLKQSCKT
jgi:hypothetical protein